MKTTIARIMAVCALAFASLPMVAQSFPPFMKIELKDGYTYKWHNPDKVGVEMNDYDLELSQEGKVKSCGNGMYSVEMYVRWGSDMEELKVAVVESTMSLVDAMVSILNGEVPVTTKKCEHLGAPVQLTYSGSGNKKVVALGYAGGKIMAKAESGFFSFEWQVNLDFSDMFRMMAKPYYIFPMSNRADDFGFPMIALSNDFEGADMTNNNNTYNWFGSCGNMTSRSGTYANPYIRYVLPYKQIEKINELLEELSTEEPTSENVYMMAQARAMRAFDYMSVAPYFVFNYEKSKDSPCVPIITQPLKEDTNPRATTEEVWNYILQDLDYAIAHLNGMTRSTKDFINKNVALGLRARAYLYMGRWKEAAGDAHDARQGYTPATMQEVSKPAFCNENEHNWMWSIRLTSDLVGGQVYPTSSSWLSAFSGDAYGSGVDLVPYINKLLWKQIPSTDVRKGWWLDENCQSPNLAGLEWGYTGVKGNDIAKYEDYNKVAYGPYTNVKFGQKSGIGSAENDNDWCLMRAEEMIFIEAEGLLKGGDETGARRVLEEFVRGNRDATYTSTTHRSLADEIWLQRRIELWGEGFFTFDMKRLGKPLVRFHEDEESNVPDAFTFNMAADDEWLNMRFPDNLLEKNVNLIDNVGGQLPEWHQNGDLRDGVTDF